MLRPMLLEQHILSPNTTNSDCNISLSQKSAILTDVTKLSGTIIKAKIISAGEM